MSEPVVVIKLDPKGTEVWRYPGQVLRRWPDSVLLEAHFNRDDMDFHGIPFGRGDRFLELYYSDRWYNIDELHDRDDDRLKGWYCNVTCPAEISDGRVAYMDLALDLLVFPDGRQLVLDEDEFAALELDEDTRARALVALAQLQELFTPPVTLRLAETSL
jgi:hypothetical protein